METIVLKRDVGTQTPADCYRQGEIESEENLKRIKFRMDCECAWAAMSGNLLTWHKRSLQLYEATAQKLTTDFLEKVQTLSQRQFFIDTCFLVAVRGEKLETIQGYFESAENFYSELEHLLPEEQRALQRTGAKACVSLLATDREGKNALHLAVERKDSAIFNYIFGYFQSRKWLDFTDAQGRTAAMMALELDYFYAFLRLAKYSLCANKQDHLGRTLLHVVASKPFAIYQKNPTVLWRVQSFQGLENIQDYWGCTPLHLAIENGNVEVAQMCAAKTNLSLRDRKGYTPLHYVTRHPDLSLEIKVRLVKILNPFPEICQVADYSGKTAVECIPLACENEALLACFGITRAHMAAYFDDLVAIFQAEYSIPDMCCQDYLGRSPLHFAVMCGEAVKVAGIVCRGNVNLQDFRGNTAAHIAFLSDMPAKDKYDILLALSPIELEANFTIRNRDGQDVVDCVPFDREHLSILQNFRTRGVFNVHQAARFRALEASVQATYATEASSSMSSSS